jgi:hypothetical protein
VSRRRLLIVPAVVAFLAIALLLARYLTTENAERDAVYALLAAQARGDVRGMLGRLRGCDGACREQVARNARRLARPGRVSILAYSSATAYALGAASGPTRVAWTIVDRQLPVVQCVQVRRAGSVLTGRTVSLRRLSAPIDRQSSC